MNSEDGEKIREILNEIDSDKENDNSTDKKNDHEYVKRKLSEKVRKWIENRILSDKDIKEAIKALQKKNINDGDYAYDPVYYLLPNNPLYVEVLLGSNGVLEDQSNVINWWKENRKSILLDNIKEKADLDDARYIISLGEKDPDKLKEMKDNGEINEYYDLFEWKQISFEGIQLIMNDNSIKDSYIKALTAWKNSSGVDDDTVIKFIETMLYKYNNEVNSFIEGLIKGKNRTLKIFKNIAHYKWVLTIPSKIGFYGLLILVGKFELFEKFLFDNFEHIVEAMQTLLSSEENNKMPLNETDQMRSYMDMFNE